MLVHLLPEQVSKYWKSISPAIESTLPEDMSSDRNRMNRILQALLSGSATCWAIVSDEGKIVGLMVTTIFVDLCVGGSDLLIYSLYSRGNITPSLVRDGMATLSDYARRNKCGRITAYTRLESVERIIKNTLGGKEEAKLMSIPINGEVKV